MAQRETLTAARVKNMDYAKPGERYEISDAGCPGLRLRVTARAKTWQAGLQVNQKRTWAVIGTYPAMSLADARKAVSERREGIIADSGADPKAATGPLATVRDLLDEYLEHLEGVEKRSDNHVRQVRSNTRDGRYSFMAFLKREHDAATVAAAVTPAMVRDWLAETYQRVPKSVHHYRANLHAAFEWALHATFDYRRAGGRRFGLTANPVTPTPTPEPLAARKVLIPKPAARALWTMAPAHADARMALLIRTVMAMGGVRIMQIAALEKDWLRDGWIYWPTDAMKARREHTLPVTRHARALIHAALAMAPEDTPLIFPGPYDRRKPLAVEVIGKAVKRIREDGGIKDAFILRDWRRTVKTAGLDGGFFEEREIDIWHDHGQNADVARKHYTFAEYRTLKAETAAKIDAFLDNYLGAAHLSLGAAA